MTTLSPFIDGIYLNANPGRFSAKGYPLPAKTCAGEKRGHKPVLSEDRCFWCGHAVKERR